MLQVKGDQACLLQMALLGAHSIRRTFDFKPQQALWAFKAAFVPL
jgi:hypothetical protein